MSFSQYTFVPNQPVVDTWINPPFNELLAAGESKQKRYNFGKGLEQELGALGQQVKAMPGHEDYKNEVLGKYNSQLKDIVNTTKDYSSPEFQKKASDLIYQFKSDSDVQKIMRNQIQNEKWAENYNTKANPLDINLTYQRDQYGDVKQHKHDFSPNVIQYKNPTDDMIKIMDKVKADSNEYNGYDKDKEGNLKITDGYLWKHGSKKEQLTDNEISQFALKNVGNFARTEGGGWMIAKTLKDHGYDPSVRYDELPSDLRKAVDGYISKEMSKVRDPYKDTSYTEGVQEDYKSKSDYDRKSKEQTSVVAGGSSGSKFDVNTFKTNKQTYQGQLDILNQQLVNSTDVNSKAQIQKQITSLNSKLRMQDDLTESALKQAGWNWEDKFKDFKNDVSVNIGTAQANSLSINDFKNLTKGSQQDFYNWMNKNSNFGSQASGTATPLQGVLSTFGKWNGVYNKQVENSMTEYTSQHDMLLGSDDSYAGIISKRMTDGVNKGSLELMNEDGTQFNKDEQLNGYTKKLNMIPLKSPIGGKPGYAITGEDENGKSKTFYVTMDDDTAGLEDYRQNANDLIEQSKTSKYASDPYKSSKLRDTGYLQYGYAVVGPQVNDAQLQTMTTGDKRDLVLGDNSKLTITAKGDKGNIYYNAYIDGTQIPGNFGNEQSLMQAIGELEYKVNVQK